MMPGPVNQAMSSRVPPVAENYPPPERHYPTNAWGVPNGQIPNGNSRESIEIPPQKLKTTALNQPVVPVPDNTPSRSNTLTSGANSDPEEGDVVNVVVRVRPISEQETSRHDKVIIQFPGDGALWIDTGIQTKSFTFNVTFEPEATQQDVFDHSGVKKLIEMALGGYCCTAFAFGQTGSGKTHTITGPPEMFQDGHLKAPKEYVGLIPRSFHYIFELMKKQPRAGFRITASFLEIYNEQVIDLLNVNHRRNLAVRWSKNKGFYVENLFHVECESITDLMAVLEEGLRNRATGTNSVNEHSSRSHSMLTLHLDSDQQDPDDENLYITKHGKLTFVDLAGSEKTKSDQAASPGHLVESNNINRSLLVLGNCISALGDAKRRSGHIPYRDSKLTKLLADSLGGNGVTLMIACVTPSSYNGAESMNTLRYANRAKKIKTKPVITMDPREKLILSLKREIKVLRQENHYLRQQLEFPVKPKGQLQRENDQKFMQMLKKSQMEGKVTTDNGLYEMLQEYMIENEHLRNENSDLHGSRDRGRREQQQLARENERLMRNLEAVNREHMMQGTPMSMYSVSSRKSSANDGRQYAEYNAASESQQYKQQNSQRGNVANGYGHPKRPPHRLSQPVNKNNPAYVESQTPRNSSYLSGQPPPPPPAVGAPAQYGYPQQHGQATPRKNYPQTHNAPAAASVPGPIMRSEGAPRHAAPVASPRKSKKVGTSPNHSNGSLGNPQTKHGNHYNQQPNGYVGESAQQMNERLRNELLELEGEIRNQSQLNTPQDGRYELR